MPETTPDVPPVTLTDEEREALVIAAAVGPVTVEQVTAVALAVAGIVAARVAAERAEWAGRVAAVEAVADEWCITARDGDFVDDEDFAEAIRDSGAWRFARDLRAALARSGGNDE